MRYPKSLCFIDPTFEQAIIVCLSVFFISALVPSIGRAQYGEKNEELKSKLHVIQEAVERYGVDHSNYPDYLLGGDLDGWKAWHRTWDGINDMEMNGSRVAGNFDVVDPLIEGGYISSYPRNPFLDNGRDTVGRTSIEGESRPGEGDPRWGYFGTKMGMGLDDPNYFKGAVHPGPFMWPEMEMRRTLDHGEWQNIPKDFKIVQAGNFYYTFGGFRDFGGIGSGVFSTYWPGAFFYKSAPDVAMGGRHLWTVPVPNTNSVGGVKNRYILGCYGSTPEGLDVIRLTGESSDGQRIHWRTPPPFSADAYYCGLDDFTGGFGQSGGLPEVFGGGDESTGPWYYYNEGGRNGGEFQYGAPDGIPDGVVLVLTDGGETWREF